MVFIKNKKMIKDPVNLKSIFAVSFLFLNNCYGQQKVTWIPTTANDLSLVSYYTHTSAAGAKQKEDSDKNKSSLS
jgi:hypothetical protein